MIQIDGRDGTTLAVEELTKTIKENNDLTAKQNEKLVSYNKTLVGLTVAIGALGLVQLIVMCVGK